jgi:hypothetical protein
MHFFRPCTNELTGPCHKLGSFPPNGAPNIWQALTSSFDILSDKFYKILISVLKEKSINFLAHARTGSMENISHDRWKKVEMLGLDGAHKE